MEVFTTISPQHITKTNFNEALLFSTLNHCITLQEVTAINMIQHIKPYLRAVLVRMKGVEWETNFTDPVRLKYHEKKMRSKDERPADQMLRLGIPYGNVLHVLDE